MRRPNVIAIAVDVIIERTGPSVVLIERRQAPHGWALPGGFVEYGETLEAAAIREAAEETSLTVELVRQFHTYSDPIRDPRGHTIATVFIARGRGTPRARYDAREIGTFSADALPSPLAFDHGQILADYFGGRY
jgi:8-oxo-dGTP diphosphatase